MGEWSAWSTYGKKWENDPKYRAEVRNRTIVSKSYNEYCDSLDTPREQHRKCRKQSYSPLNNGDIKCECKTEQECREWPCKCRPLECEKQLKGSLMAIFYFDFLPGTDDNECPVQCETEVRARRYKKYCEMEGSRCDSLYASGKR